MTFRDIFANLFTQVGKSSQELARDQELDQEMMNQRARNALRMAKIKEEMGTKYILHPSHMKTCLDEPRPV